MVRQECYSAYLLQYLAGLVWVAGLSELPTFKSVGLYSWWYPDGRLLGSIAVRLTAPTRCILLGLGLLICL